MSIVRRRAVTLALILACSVPALLAQTAGVSANQTSAQTDRRIADLEQQVQMLKSEIAAIKASGAARGPALMPTSLTTTAVAPDAPSAPAAAPAAAPAKPEPLAGLASVLNGAAVTGLVDTYYQYNANQPGSRTSGLRLFDSRTNQFALNLIELGLVKTPDADNRLGYNLTFGYGDAMNVVNAGDLASTSNPFFLQYLKEGYLSYFAPVGKGLQIDAGKFVTPNGAEVIESNANWNYSRSILFNYAIPFYHFGLRAKYAFNDKYAVTGYVVNGWNDVIHDQSNGFANSGKTGGLSFAWTPNKKWSFVENWMGGPGATPQDGSNCLAPNGLCSNAAWRNLSDTVITYSPTGKLTLMANGDYGRSESFLGSPQPVEWWGGAGYAKYQFNPRYAVATRYEYYNDVDGVTTGIRQHLQEVTGTLERRFAQHLISRFEYRHDFASQPFFQKGVNNTLVKGQNTLAAGLIFVLEPSETK